MDAEWIKLVQTVGVPLSLLLLVLTYVGKVLLPAQQAQFKATLDLLIAEHQRDRESFSKAISDMTAAIREMAKALGSCPLRRTGATEVPAG